MSRRQWHGQRQTITYQLDVSFLLELSGDEGAHLGMLFPSVQRRPCREAQLEIGATGLSEGGLSRLVI
jgi:hypothetical protein